MANVYSAMIIGLAFMLYAWRTFLWEFSYWKKAMADSFHFLGTLQNLFLALIFHFNGYVITTLIQRIETAPYTVQAFYSRIVAYTPIQELKTVMKMTSAVC